MKKIIFFYPSYVLGGAEILFARLSEYIVDIYEVIIVDYENGIYSKLITNPKVKLIVMSMDKTVIDGDAIIIMPPVWFDKLSLLKLSPKTKFIIWMLHPFNMVKGPVIYSRLKIPFLMNKVFLKVYNNVIYFKNRKFVKNLISKANQECGFYFMDGETYNVTKILFDIDVQPEFIQIPITGKNRLVQTNKDLRTVINIGYLGRLEDFKVTILKYLISDFNDTPSAYSIRLHILGDGKDKLDIMRFCKQYVSIQFIFVGKLYLEDLHNYISENIDCLFAMGTSALEAAFLGIPTCLLDASYTKVSLGYKYKWLYETPDFVLGRLLDIENIHCENNKTLIQIIDDLKNNYELIAKKCQQYALENHNIDIVANKLINAINNSTFTYSDLKVIING